VVPILCTQSIYISIVYSTNPHIYTKIPSDQQYFSQEVLDGLRNSPGLQSLAICSENFREDDDEAYAGFLSSLNSTALRRLTIHGWDFRRDVAFPMEIFQNLSLTHFSMINPTFNEASWRTLLQEIPKCTTLISLEFEHVDWWGSKERDDAVLEFSIDFAQFLKNNPNIVSTNKRFMGNDYDVFAANGDIVYNTHIAPILEYNCLMKNLKTLKERGNDKERGFLVAEAVGTRSATKVSSCYPILKANMDVLVSCISSQSLSSGKKRTLCSVHN